MRPAWAGRSGCRSSPVPACCCTCTNSYVLGCAVAERAVAGRAVPEVTNSLLSIGGALSLSNGLRILGSGTFLYQRSYAAGTSVFDALLQAIHRGNQRTRRRVGSTSLLALGVVAFPRALGLQNLQNYSTVVCRSYSCKKPSFIKEASCSVRATKSSNSSRFHSCV